MEESIRREFGLPVQREIGRLDLGRFYDPQRGQYRSTDILKELLVSAPSDALRVIGIVHVDLFIPILTFVFGEAQLNGRVGVVSIARLRQEFYGLPSNQPLLQRRLIKEVKHELGHTFGLLHCSRRECVMSVATSVLDVDAKGLAFCEACRGFLRAALRSLC